MTATDDYGPGIYYVTIPTGQTTFSFNISLVDDNIREGNEKFRIIIDQDSLPDNIGRGSRRKTTVTIKDNDGK